MSSASEIREAADDAVLAQRDGGGGTLRGKPILTLGFDEHQLQAGGTISFDSTTPHGYRTRARSPPWACQGRVRQRHNSASCPPDKSRCGEDTDVLTTANSSVAWHVQ
jgi:hypothetical protein